MGKRETRCAPAGKPLWQNKRSASIQRRKTVRMGLCSIRLPHRRSLAEMMIALGIRPR